MKETSTTGCLFLLLISPFALWWRGFALSVLWGWFIVPVFHAPALSVPYAVGLATVVNFLVPSGPDCEKPERTDAERWGALIGKALLWPAFSLVFGWLIRLFV